VPAPAGDAVEGAVSTVVDSGEPGPSPAVDGVAQPADEIQVTADLPPVTPSTDATAALPQALAADDFSAFGREGSAFGASPDINIVGTDEVATASLPSEVEPGLIPEPSIVLEDLAEALPVVGAIGIAALGAAAIARGACTPAASVVFTNVRLIPCFADDTVRRITTSFAGNAESGRTGSSAAAAVTNRASGFDFDFDFDFGQKIRDGFDRVVRPAPDDQGDALADSRLLVQLGMLLGVLYLAFLTVWFWATRIRWNPRSHL
jgi:hypothetical protein